MSDDTPDEVCEVCGFPSDELNGEGECLGCEGEREADSNAPGEPSHPLVIPMFFLMVIGLIIGIWLFASAEQTPSAAAIRVVCLHHEGVANVDTLEPILNRPVVVCRDGYVGYVP